MSVAKDLNDARVRRRCWPGEEPRRRKKQSRSPLALRRDVERRRADHDLHVFGNALREFLGLDPIYLPPRAKGGAP